MTYEEAIEILETVPEYDSVCSSLQEACELAISALKMRSDIKEQGNLWEEYARKLNDDEVKRLKRLLEKLNQELAKR